MFANVLLIASVLVGTWNLKWFPSGRAEHRAKPEAEAATIAAAAGLLRTETSGRGEAGTILFLEEMRDGAACSNLVAQIGDPRLQLASVSAFRDFDRRLQWQQTAIVTDLPVLESRYSYWKRTRKLLPPRGYAYALLDAGTNGLIACYCVHLKSNYGATTPEVHEQNRLKREMCMQQLVQETKRLTGPDGRKVETVVIAGDFNTDPWTTQFAAEQTVHILLGAGYRHCFEAVAADLAARATHPGRGRWPDGTLDFIFVRGPVSLGCVHLSPSLDVSDHRAVWWKLD